MQKKHRNTLLFAAPIATVLIFITLNGFSLSDGSKICEPPECTPLAPSVCVATYPEAVLFRCDCNNEEICRRDYVDIWSIHYLDGYQEFTEDWCEIRNVSRHYKVSLVSCDTNESSLLSVSTLNLSS